MHKDMRLHTEVENMEALPVGAVLEIGDKTFTKMHEWTWAVGAETYSNTDVAIRKQCPQHDDLPCDCVLCVACRSRGCCKVAA